MDCDERREFYEKLYFHALNARDSVDSRLKLPLAVLGIVSAMLGYLSTETILKAQPVPHFYWLAFSLAWISLIVAIWFFIRAWHGYTYRILPIPNILESYYSEIRLKCEAAETEEESGEAVKWAKEQFNEYLLNAFKSVSSHNILNNNRKSTNLHRSATAAILAFVFVGVAYIPYYYAISINPSMESFTNVP